MTMLFHEGSVASVLVGDCLESLRMLPDCSANMCVTSPPYYGLRDYGTGSWVGGNPNCDHKGDPFRTKANINANWGDGSNDVKNAADRQPFKSICGKCGAHRVDMQIGLEDTPDAYVARLVEVFREVRRVLTDDGTLWLNIGDSYASPTKGSGGAGKSTLGPNKDLQNIEFQKMMPRKFNMGDCKQKDLIGIPWMLAFALRADGWYLRQEIIWNKPNPMPESVTDRCTKAHESVFLLSKSARYFFDHEAIKEPAVYAPGKTKEIERAPGYYAGKFSESNESGRNDKSFKAIRETRNKRSVWTVAPKPYAGAHFAVYPPELITPCILAGCPVGGIVLDPFGGSGTTAGVALAHGRNAILCELNPDYAALMPDRARHIIDRTVFIDDAVKNELTLRNINTKAVNVYPT